jgi:hypothetical protein
VRLADVPKRARLLVRRGGAAVVIGFLGMSADVFFHNVLLFAGAQATLLIALLFLGCASKVLDDAQAIVEQMGREAVERQKHPLYRSDLGILAMKEDKP